MFFASFSIYLEEWAKVHHLAELKDHELEQDYHYSHWMPFGLVRNWSDIVHRGLLAEHMLAKGKILNENFIKNLQFKTIGPNIST